MFPLFHHVPLILGNLFPPWTFSIHCHSHWIWRNLVPLASSPQRGKLDSKPAAAEERAMVVVPAWLPVRGPRQSFVLSFCGHIPYIIDLFLWAEKQYTRTLMVLYHYIFFRPSLPIKRLTPPHCHYSTQHVWPGALQLQVGLSARVPTKHGTWPKSAIYLAASRICLVLYRIIIIYSVTQCLQHVVLCFWAIWFFNIIDAYSLYYQGTYMYI